MTHKTTNRKATKQLQCYETLAVINPGDTYTKFTGTPIVMHREIGEIFKRRRADFSDIEPGELGDNIFACLRSTKISEQTLDEADTYMRLRVNPMPWMVLALENAKRRAGKLVETEEYHAPEVPPLEMLAQLSEPEKPREVHIDEATWRKLDSAMYKMVAIAVVISAVLFSAAGWKARDWYIQASPKAAFHSASYQRGIADAMREIKHKNEEESKQQ